MRKGTTKKSKTQLKQLENKIRIKHKEKKGYKKLEGILTNVLNKLALEDGFFSN